MNAIPGYRLKIERAKRHVGELATDIQRFLAGNPYAIFTDDDPGGGNRHWKVKIQQCVPAAWSAIIGDAIHNARAALDLLAVAVVRHCDPARVSYNHVHFVIRESRDKFESALPENIKGASPEAERIFHDLKPYKGGDEAFWRLHQLDILDKHKAIIPVGAAHRSIGMTFDPRKMFPTIFPPGEAPDPITLFLRPADRQFPLQNGTSLYTCPIASVDLPFHENLKFTFEIAFGEGQIIDGEPVAPSLAQICDFVEGIISTFERHILGL